MDWGHLGPSNAVLKCQGHWQHKSRHWWVAYDVLSASQASSHLILPTAPWGGCRSTHFTDEQSKLSGLSKRQHCNCINRTLHRLVLPLHSHVPSPFCRSITQEALGTPIQICSFCTEEGKFGPRPRPAITQVRCPKPRPVHWEDGSETEKYIRHQAKPAILPLQWTDLTARA